MASWVAWLTANAVFTIAAFHEGSYVGGAIDVIATLANILVVAASLHKKVGAKPGDSIDWACLASSVACVGAIVLLPNDMLMGALLGMVANATATIPTLRHAWSKPREETWQLFAANASAGALSLLSIVMMDGFALESTAGPLMTVIGSTSLVVIVLGRKWLTRLEVSVAEEIRVIEDGLSGTEVLD